MTRSAMGIAPNRPIPHVLNALERAGALVLAVAPIVMHIEAFSAWAGTESPRPVLVAVMEKAGDRGRMSACHDLGHLVLPARGDQKQAEREAFQFAAEFLMPADAMYEELAAPVTLTKLADSKARWGVAIQALVRRAKDLNIITDRQYRYLSEQIGINGWRTNEPVFIPSEKPRGLRKMVELVYGNPINVKKFADDLCLVPPLAEEILALYAPGGGSSFAGPLRDVPPPSPRGTASNVRPFRRR
jgi:Zn-dependent peptidase ImmA (M78 family)